MKWPTWLSFKPELNATNVIALSAIVVTGIGIGIANNNEQARVDREVAAQANAVADNQRQQARAIREAAAFALTKIDRSNEINLTLFPEARRVASDIANVALPGNDNRERGMTDPDREAALTFASVQVEALGSNIVTQMAAEEIELGFSGLLAYYPQVRVLYLSALAEAASTRTIWMRTIDNAFVLGLNANCCRNDLTRAGVEGALVRTFADIDGNYAAQLETKYTEITAFLEAIVNNRDDAALLRGE